MDNLSYECRMSKAIADLKSSLKPNCTHAARKWKLGVHAVRRRYKGQTTSRAAATSQYRKNLSDAQEEVLVDQIRKLTAQGLPPTSQIVKNLAEEIIDRPVGKNWVGQFVRRHNDVLVSVYLRNYDNKRVKTEYSPMIEEYYRLLKEVIEKYNITAECVYNWDEKGFLIGFAQTVKRILTRSAYESGRATISRQDGNHEFISLLAFICADGTAGPPTLIYKGASGCLLDTWVDEVEASDKAFFAVSPNGWSSNDMGLSWLINVFDPSTRRKAGNRRRLLIVDGQSGHLNMAFINACDERRILLSILPPHSTHRLQPLDVSLFLPLSTAYSKRIQKVLNDIEGITQMTKRDFWRVFRPSFKDSFTLGNITSGFSKTGIWPYNPPMVLDIISPRLTTSPQYPSVTGPQYLKATSNAHELRLLSREASKEGLSETFDKMAKSAEVALAKLSISEHRAEELQEALQNETKKRKCGKRLNILGQEASGALIVGPEEIVKAREYAAEQEALREKELEDEAIEKEEKTTKKVEAKDLQAENKLQREIMAEFKRETKGWGGKKKAPNSTTTIKPPTLEVGGKKATKPKAKPKARAVSFKAPGNSSLVEVQEASVVEVVRVSRSGRTIRPPPQRD